jgi:hypothetical protein
VAPILQRGSIVWATIPNSKGELPEDHPCIVMDGQSDIDSSFDLHVVGISTTVPPRPLPPHVFDVPSRPGGHPQTGLEEVGVAYADWMPTIPQSKVRRISGRAPATLVKQIALWQRDFYARRSATETKATEDV